MSGYRENQIQVLVRKMSEDVVRTRIMCHEATGSGHSEELIQAMERKSKAVERKDQSVSGWRTRGRLYKEKSNLFMEDPSQGPLKKGSVSTVSKIQAIESNRVRP